MSMTKVGKLKIVGKLIKTSFMDSEKRALFTGKTTPIIRKLIIPKNVGNLGSIRSTLLRNHGLFLLPILYHAVLRCLPAPFLTFRRPRTRA
jgi:hypothetical protein